jgi:flagellar basal-body rod protein FlgC
MDLFAIFNVTGGGMTAQRSRINVVAGNLANAETTRTPEGGPYQRRNVVFRTQPAENEFSTLLASGPHLSRVDPRSGQIPFASPDNPQQILSVRVDAIQESEREAKKTYDPHHPDADAAGYVSYPDINPMEEMTDLLSAVRSYEANLTTFNATKTLVHRLLEIGRNA